MTNFDPNLSFKHLLTFKALLNDLNQAYLQLLLWRYNLGVVDICLLVTLL